MTTHDYGPGRRRWGHDYAVTKVLDDGQRLRVTGWGSGLTSGDLVLLANGDRSTQYQVEHIRYASDPLDMWHAELVFAPRQGA